MDVNTSREIYNIILFHQHLIIIYFMFRKKVSPFKSFSVYFYVTVLCEWATNVLYFVHLCIRYNYKNYKVQSKKQTHNTPMNAQGGEEV
jgi:hypothetical protein